MKDDRFQKIEGLFQRARRLPPDERAAFVAELRDADASIGDELAALLREHEDGAELEDAFATLSPAPEAGPARIGPYTIRGELGRGGQGVVYLAEDPRLGRNVALKVVASSSAFTAQVRERLKREAEAVSKLDHPAICGVYEMGEADGLAFIAMRFVEGEPLDRKVHATRESGGLSTVVDIASGEHVAPGDSAPTGSNVRGRLVDAVRLIERAARALHVAHEAGFVHRDVKPGNIMVTPAGEPVLLDFGLARDVETDLPTLTHSGQLMGTPAYMSPEQLTEGATGVDRRTDVYSLGVTLYECLTLTRPFEAATREQLYQQILTQSPPNPRKKNARIPRDLQVILETALEKRRDRRYQTAEAFAEDLRRWREHEPIRAKPIGIARRVAKWTRRHPGRAVAAAGVLLAALATVALVLGARARTRSAAFTAAAEARDEAAEKSRQYVAATKKLVAQRRAVAAEREACHTQYASTAQRAALARRERALSEAEAGVARLLAEGREALERAVRYESPYTGGVASDTTKTAFATFFLARFREHRAAGTQGEAKRYADKVREYGGDRYEKDLTGRGTLRVDVEPADAAVYLFRYASYETVRTDRDVVPRLVPVPTTGIGLSRPGAWSADLDFVPGDPCLHIVSVDEQSPAGKAGLRPGDLVVRLNDEPCGVGLFVDRVPERGPAGRAGVQSLDRIESLDGETVEGIYEWYLPKRKTHPGNKPNPVCEMVAGGITVRAAWRSGLDRTLGVSVREPASLVNDGARAAMRLVCLHDGEPVEFEVPAGETSGLTCEVTTYPLILSPLNRIASGDAFDADPGSYLVVARHAGFEDQRYVVVVPHGGEARAHLRLLNEGSTPPGFVYVPPGPFAFGGDSSAYLSGSANVVDLPGFFIARKELTLREWFAFLNDPATQKSLRSGEQPPDRLLPRGRNDRLRRFARFDGKRYVPTYGTPVTPVAGISWNDVQAYLAWRNAEAKAAGEKWQYAMPSQEQWEKAARGDRRWFPWGNRFDHSLTMGLHRKRTGLGQTPGAMEPRDESPYGVIDMAGSRYEWTASAADAFNRIHRGGAWGNFSVRNFRSTNSNVYEPFMIYNDLGVRIIATLRKDP